MWRRLQRVEREVVLVGAMRQSRGLGEHPHVVGYEIPGIRIRNPDKYLIYCINKFGIIAVCKTKRGFLAAQQR